MPPTVFPPRRYVSGMELLYLLCGYFPYIACIPSHTHLLAFLFWMLLPYSNLFLLRWLRHIIFIFNAKVCILVGFGVLIYTSFFSLAVFGVWFVDFLFISLYGWTEHRSIEMKSDIAWSCCKLPGQNGSFRVHGSCTSSAVPDNDGCGPFRSHSFSSHGFIPAG